MMNLEYNFEIKAINTLVNGLIFLDLSINTTETRQIPMKEIFWRINQYEQIGLTDTYDHDFN